jgi:hypothetical protein
MTKGMIENSAGDRACEIPFGSHVFRWEPPDFGYIVYDGYVDGPMVASFSTQSRPILLGKPWIFMLVDVTKLTKITSEGRKLSAQGSKDLNLRGVAIVGASPSMRVIAGLVSRAVEILGGSTNNPTRFFENEREAHAWIATRRSELQGSAKLP